MRILGVDPGGSGALALLEGSEIRVADMPVFKVRRGKSDKPELDVHGLSAILDDWRPEACFFERVFGMTDQSAPAAFNFGRIAGAAEAIVKTAGARFEFVAPHVWKKALKIRGKDDARAIATNLWPSAAGEFRRKMDQDRAEAALIAEYGRMQLIKNGVFG